MTSTTSLFLLLTLAASPEPGGGADPMVGCPLHASHLAEAQHAAGVTQRGETVMGFSHRTTVHHFRLTPAGGTISVSATNDSDRTSIDKIRTHLANVAHAFASGDFAMPERIHGQVLPGSATMRKQRLLITYRFEAMPQGGRIVIVSQDAGAIDAVHAFLRFQIADHHTGDSTTVAAE